MSAATLRVPLACWHESLESARTDPLTQLSEDGAFLLTDRPLTVGLPVFLELRLGTASNAAIGQIDAVVTAKRNGDAEAGFDVRFVDLDDALRVWIKHHVGAPEPAPLPELGRLSEEESLSDGFSLRPGSNEEKEAAPTDPFAVFDEPSQDESDDHFDPFAPEGFAPSTPAFAEESGTDAEEGFGFFDEPSRPATPSLTAAAANPFGDTSIDDALPAPEPIEALDPFASPARPVTGDDFAPMASLDGTEEDLGVDLEPFDVVEPEAPPKLPEIETPPEPEAYTDPARSNPSLEVFDEVVSDEESMGGASFNFGEARPQTAILGTRVPQLPRRPEPDFDLPELPEIEVEELPTVDLPEVEAAPEVVVAVPEPARAPKAFKNTQRMPIPDFAKPEPEEKLEEEIEVKLDEKPPSETQSFHLDDAFLNASIPKPEVIPDPEPIAPETTQAFRPSSALFTKPVEEPPEEPQGSRPDPVAQDSFPDALFETQAFSFEPDLTEPDKAPEPEPEPKPEPPARQPVSFETTERFVIAPPAKTEVPAPQEFTSTQQFAVWTPDTDVHKTSDESDIPTVVGEVHDYDLALPRTEAPAVEQPRTTDQFAAWTPEVATETAQPVAVPATVSPEAAAALRPMVLEGLEPSANETLPLGVQAKDLKELARAFPEENAGRTSTLQFGAVDPVPTPTPSVTTLGPPADTPSLPADEVIDWNAEAGAAGVSPFLSDVPAPSQTVPVEEVSPFLDPAPAPVAPSVAVATPRPLTPVMGSVPPSMKSGPVSMSAEALELVDVDLANDDDVEVKGEPRMVTFDELDGAPVGAIELPVAKLAGGSEKVELDVDAFPDFDLPLDPFRENPGPEMTQSLRTHAGPEAEVKVTNPQPIAPAEQVPVSLSFGAEEWHVNEPGTADQQPSDDVAFELDLDLAIDDSAFTGDVVATDDLDEAWVVAKEDDEK